MSRFSLTETCICIDSSIFYYGVPLYSWTFVQMNVFHPPAFRGLGEDDLTLSLGIVFTLIYCGRKWDLAKFAENVNWITWPGLWFLMVPDQMCGVQWPNFYMICAIIGFLNVASHPANFCCQLYLGYCVKCSSQLNLKTLASFHLLNIWPWTLFLLLQFHF